MLRSEHAHFSLVWDRATSLQRRVLVALAASPAGRSASEYRAATTSRPVERPARAAEPRGEELVARDGSMHRIAEPFLAEWILRDASV